MRRFPGSGTVTGDPSVWEIPAKGSRRFDMGDFLLDLRASEERAPGKAAEFLKFYPDMRVDRLE